MATIYRFIIEEKGKSGSGSGTGSKAVGSGSAKKGKWVGIFGGGKKGGVEHNRKLRAINPLLNKATFGYWEKGMRVSRAGLGLVQRNTETNHLRLSGVSVAIILSLVLQTLFKWQNAERKKAEQYNTANFKAMENGYSSIHGEFTTSVNVFTGKKTYNENR